MLSKAEIEAVVKRCGSETKAAKELGVARSTFQGWRKNGMSKYVKSAPAVKSAGRSLAEFRATYDKAYIVPVKIRAALKTLGKNGWDYEALFARLAGVSTADIAMVRDQFSAHIVVVARDGRRAWAGTPKLAKELRGMIR